MLARSRIVFQIPSALGMLRDLRDTMAISLVIISGCIEEHLHRESAKIRRQDKYRLVEIVIIDEAERLPTSAFELVRDIFDRTGMGIILIGVPGMEKRLSRYLQLYSHVGFAHHYRPLQGDELTFGLTRQQCRLGLALEDADFTDAQAVASIARITRGNFRLLRRLFVQIGRILKINGLAVITKDVVEAARSTLVIGAK